MPLEARERLGFAGRDLTLTYNLVAYGLVERVTVRRGEIPSVETLALDDAALDGLVKQAHDHGLATARPEPRGQVGGMLVDVDIGETTTALPPDKTTATANSSATVGLPLPSSVNDATLIQAGKQVYPRQTVEAIAIQKLGSDAAALSWSAAILCRTSTAKRVKSAAGRFPWRVSTSRRVSTS
ncbi:hypothetical protein LTR54_018112 [Friedmanniomyces endolithicus]|nr:hypothetical protein LTR54_018112 [Friedmanniomyces endolithicus]